MINIIYKITYCGADRLSFSATPGAAWRSAGKGKAVTYVTNAANSVKLYHAALSGSSLIKDGYYAAGRRGRPHPDYVHR